LLKRIAFALVILASVESHACASEAGVASWYGASHQGHPTASGELFNTNAPTCAHKTLPLGSVVRVTRLDGTASAICRVNDRGPFVRGRVIDLSHYVAQQVGISGKQGVAKVVVEVVWRGHARSSR
jgi:rare lipoprotein A